MTFLQHCIQPDAILMLFVAIVSFVGYGYPAVRQANPWPLWLLWLFVGILAIVSWVVLVLS